MNGISAVLAAVLIAAGVFFLVRAKYPAGKLLPAWRCRLMSLGCFLWGFYLVLYSFHFTNWIIDIFFVILLLGFWLGRDRADFLAAFGGIVWTLGARHAVGAPLLLLLAVLAYPTVVLLWGQRWFEREISARVKTKKSSWSMPSVAAAAGVFVILVYHGARPTLLMVAPEKRRLLLEAKSPQFPISNPETLSPLASRLRGHVLALAQGIGERSAYQPEAQEKAKEYVIARLKEAGYTPLVMAYEADKKTDFQRRIPYYNIEAVLPAEDDSSAGVWLVGAHYDSAPGTPGADDNASGVAVLLEAARMLKNTSPGRGICFVAFGTEEPPAFGTRDMGSFRYARGLKERGITAHGMINLEMLGYFNPQLKSQLFPPFLHLIYPDRADFIGLVCNLSSMRLCSSFRKSWSAGSRVPMEMTILPGVFSTLALSDQLNFWHEGIPAIMLSDTSFFRYPYYHQAQDTVEKLDYERMAAVTEGVVHALSTKSP